jgi:hypothetical protein
MRLKTFSTTPHCFTQARHSSQSIGLTDTTFFSSVRLAAVEDRICSCGLRKGDVKKHSELEYLVKRDCSHLRDEDRWIDARTKFRNGFPMVLEPESHHVRAGIMRDHVRA